MFHHTEEKGRNMGPVAVGKSVLYIDTVTQHDIDTYRYTL